MKKLLIGVLVGLLLGGGALFAATKWSDYGELTAGNMADGDDFLIRDVSDTSLAATGTQKRYSWASLKLDFEDELDNSAGLLAALSDETGTGVAVFGTAPTFTTSITIGSAGIGEAELEILDETV